MLCYFLPAKSIQWCLILCDPTDCSPPSSSVHGILQARILKWVAILFSKGSSWPRDWTWILRIAGRFFTIWATRGYNYYSLLASGEQSNMKCLRLFRRNASSDFLTHLVFDYLEWYPGPKLMLFSSQWEFSCTAYVSIAEWWLINTLEWKFGFSKQNAFRNWMIRLKRVLRMGQK